MALWSAKQQFYVWVQQNRSYYLYVNKKNLWDQFNSFCSFNYMVMKNIRTCQWQVLNCEISYILKKLFLRWAWEKASFKEMTYEYPSLSFHHLQFAILQNIICPTASRTVTYLVNNPSIKGLSELLYFSGLYIRFYDFVYAKGIIAVFSPEC